MQIPTCKKCGKDHYHFVRCDKVDEWNKKRVENKPKLEVIFQPDKNLRPWGDRINNYERIAGNVFVLRREHDGPEAA